MLRSRGARANSRLFGEPCPGNQEVGLNNRLGVGARFRMAKKKYEYEVALSFAGEDRRHAEKLAKLLRSEGLRVFYDKYEQKQLWGKDLYQHLQVVYRDKAQFCVIFASAAYARKLWTKHELKQAQERAFRENREYILPLRLDDTKIPGVPETVGYLDLRSVPIVDVADMLIDKVSGKDPFERPSKWDGSMVTHRGVRMASFWPRRIKDAQKWPAYVVTFERVKYGDEEDDWGASSGLPCGDCGVKKGEFHVPSCDVERCPACGDQALTCECDGRVATGPLSPN